MGHEVIDLLRQKARPYLFSNTLSPPSVAVISTALDLLTHSREQITRLYKHTSYFRSKMREAGFTVFGSELPTCPVFIGNHWVAQDVAGDLKDRGILVKALYAPYVPNNKAIIRVNMNAAHTEKDVKYFVDSFIQVGKEHNLLKKIKLSMLFILL